MKNILEKKANILLKKHHKLVAIEVLHTSNVEL